MSTNMVRFYKVTAPGRSAWVSERSGLPPHYRQILGLVGKVQTAEAISSAMGSPSRQQVQDWLDELETLCFVELELLQAQARAA